MPTAQGRPRRAPTTVLQCTDPPPTWQGTDPDPATGTQASLCHPPPKRPSVQAGPLPGEEPGPVPPRLTHSTQPVSWHEAVAVPSPRPDALAGPCDSLPGRTQDAWERLGAADHFLVCPAMRHVGHTDAETCFICNANLTGVLYFFVLDPAALAERPAWRRLPLALSLRCAEAGHPA